MNADQKAAERNRQAYLVRAVLAAQNEIAPELLVDYVGGTTTEEIDRSIEMAKAKSASLIQRALQGQVGPHEDPAQVNVREGYGDQQLADQVAAMSMQEYGRQRQNLGVHRDLLSFLGGGA